MTSAAEHGQSARSLVTFRGHELFALREPGSDGSVRQRVRRVVRRLNESWRAGGDSGALAARLPDGRVVLRLDGEPLLTVFEGDAIGRDHLETARAWVDAINDALDATGRRADRAGEVSHGAHSG